MKSRFSTTWNRSKQPRKQRKFRANAPNHVKGKFMNAPLSKELREKHGTRSTRIRKDDKVKVLRGEHKGEEATVARVDVKQQHIYLTGLEINRRDGSKAQPPIRPSNVMITALTEDKKRFKEEKK